MPQIIIAKDAGACFGVERAISLALDEAHVAPRGIFTMGPVVHNKRVVDALALRGIRQGQLEELPEGSKLVVRAHGVTPHELALATERGLILVDATCPFVKRVQDLAHSLELQGYQVVLVGDAGHAEVEGICGHAPSAVVLGSADEVDGLTISGPIAVIAQTTQSIECVEEVISALQARGFDVEFHNTICAATTKHQAGAIELAAQVDVMLVLGGFHSANTCRLTALCTEINPKTYQLEGPDELDPAWFSGAQSIGITAGASTPQSQLEELQEELEVLLGDAEA
ncbi:MAG: 4-hydroxy-3-methylbut-2-enyl diphosphate reductase [Atopobiaceae bacterium]|nr:4-hydroxy-3-methylbut-2-enyl diphosphate reductase [Atopobiaceae bacterium]